MGTQSNIRCKQKIMVVDDEELFLELTEEFFSEAGIDIITTSNPESVLNLFEKHSPSVLITDLSLPNCSGIDLAFKVKQLYPSTKVIFITGYSELNYQDERLVSLMGSRILHKPFPITSLIHLAESLQG
ncbi:response regulator [bacterium]|nr:response regulator [bacterium]